MAWTIADNKQGVKCPLCGGWKMALKGVETILPADSCYDCTRRRCYTKTEALSLAAAWRVKPSERVERFTELDRLPFTYGGSYQISGELVLRSAWDRIIDIYRKAPPWKPVKLPTIYPMKKEQRK